MGEEVEETRDFIEEIVVFIPSHLTVGMVSGAISLVTGAFALWQLSKVDKEEIEAFLRGG